jgi:hypothetical protein
VKTSLGLSPFKLVYGVEAVFPSQLALPVAKFFQDYQGETDHMIRRIQQLFEVYQTQEKLQDTRYIKYAEQKRNARNDRITVKYPA